MQACQEHFQDEKVKVLQIPKIHTLLYVYLRFNRTLYECSAIYVLHYCLFYFYATQTFDFHIYFLFDNLYFSIHDKITTNYFQILSLLFVL